LRQIVLHWRPRSFRSIIVERGTKVRPLLPWNRPQGRSVRTLWEVAMDRVTRCLHCGKRMVPAPSYTGRTELKCLFCDKLDPAEMVEPNKWADSPLTAPISETTP
jgi:hypothetical protein